VLTKKGKSRVHQPPPSEDETPAFYEAQLVHYGLKPLKTRPAAKNALLVSFKANDRTLTVPEGIVKLESDLAAQFEVKNAVARKKHHAQRKREREAEELKHKKRKRDEEELMAEFHETTSKKAKPNQVCYPPSASPRPPLTLRDSHQLLCL